MVGQPPSSADSIPTIEPMARFDGAAGRIDSIALSPDGSAAWFTAETPALNVFAALQSSAPWIYFGYPVLLLLVLLPFVRRISKRPRIAGRSYCRGCNYDLSGRTEAPACPECGRDLLKHKPIAGRGRRRRYGVPVLVAVIMLWPILWARTPSRLPRRVCELLDVWYIAAPQRALTDFPALARARILTGAERLWRSGLDGNEPRRLMTTSRTFVEITVTPDGKHLIMPMEGREGIVLYDSDSGAAFLQRPGRLHPVNIHEPLAIGFTPDGNGVYVQWTHPTKDLDECGVSFWDLRTNTLQSVVSRTSWAGKQGFGQPSHYRMLKSDSSPLVLELPDFMQAYEEKKVTPVLHSGGAPKALPSIASADPSGRAAIASGLGLAFFAEQYGRKILAIDLNDGAAVGSLGPPAPMDHFWGELAFNDARHLLLTPLMEKSILIRDVERKKWIARLAVPEGCYAPYASFSADGTKVCARVQRKLGGAPGAPSRATGPAGTGAGGATTSDALVWDLSGVLNAPTPEPEVR